MDLLRALAAFARVTETGSFSAVARERHESQSAVTRLITQLEAHFGVRLFHRSTRRVALTEDGRELLGHARQMLEMAAAMEAGLGRQRGSPQGLVRLGTSVAFGLFLTPRVPGLLARHPGLLLELVMRDQFGDLIEERLDLATRSGPIADTSVVARAIGTARRIAVAAPVYLERRSPPAEPADLAAHDCILHNGPDDAAGWRFVGPGGLFAIPVTGRFSANDSEAVHVAVLGGQGIAMLPELRVIDDIRAGRLHRVLAGYQSPGEPAFITYPSRRHLAPRTRAVIEFVAEQVREMQQQLAAHGDAAGDAWLV
ncbi:MAG TPA: LysR family transcriptional regulator [Acetobacteraceae bacterium]|nr:LysR family transcriptional regulator [Acetobacteraceae bacterium]